MMDYCSKIIMNTKYVGWRWLLMAMSLVGGESVAMTSSTLANGITDGTQIKHSPTHAALMLMKEQNLSAEHLNQSMHHQAVVPFGLDSAVVNDLANHVLWRRLLMFADAPKNTHHEQSRIRDASFFLSKTGKNSPKDELIAMLDALERQDWQAICRFPARTHFLVQELSAMGVAGLERLWSMLDERCVAFYDWSMAMQGQSLSLMFAEEHGDNIASAFAHVFLRLDLANQDDKQAVAMNHTVFAKPDDGVLAHAIKPLVGAYAGVMEIVPYRLKEADYLVKDERDLWRYVLRLNHEQIAQIMRHIWEVKDVNRPYYLTHDNCATEIARLVDVVRADQSLMRRLGKVATPSEVVRIFDEFGMIERTDYYPSNATKRQAIINHGAAFDASFLSSGKGNPDTASPTHRLGIRAVYDDKTTYGLSVRSAYQDWLDRPDGVRQFHEVILPSLTLGVSDDEVAVQELILFKTTRLNPVNTASVNQSASRVFFGLMQAVDVSGSQHKVLDVHVQQGRAVALGQVKTPTGKPPNTACYALVGGGGQFGRVDDGYRVGVRASTGCVHQGLDRYRVMGEIELPYWYHQGRFYTQPSLTMGVQYDLSRHHAFRVTGVIQKNHHQVNHEVRAELLKYF